MIFKVVCLPEAKWNKYQGRPLQKQLICMAYTRQPGGKGRKEEKVHLLI